MVTKAQILDLFKGNIHCSQIVLGEMADQLGYSREEAYKMANAFGGGAFIGDTCGAVAGAMIAIGLKYGNDEPGNKEQDLLCRAKVKEFQDKFKERRNTLYCRELLGYNFAIPEERQAAFDTGKVFELCPCLVMDALDILNNIFEEDN
jgi:C_GCAxxG_C_C family probable redox protein